ncbi:MAG TPA: hypothetical protein VFH71_11840 [Rhodanobacteraceae bacterium]|nr:hypothetical protein [Rhodanobacteraceae bacterium]
MSIVESGDYERRLERAIQAALMIVIANDDIRLVNGRFRIGRELDASVRELHETARSLRLPGMELTSEPVFEHGRALLPFLRSDDDQRDIPACRASVASIRGLVADRSRKLEDNAKRQRPLPVEAILQKGEAPFLRAMTQLATQDAQLAVSDERGRTLLITPPPGEHFATPPMPQTRTVKSEITGCKLKVGFKHVLLLDGLEVEVDFDEATIRKCVATRHVFIGGIRKDGGKWHVDADVDYDLIEGGLQADLME